MSVDPEKKRIVLIVHGVQIDSDADLKHDSIVDGAVRRRLDGTPLDYECDLFRYENMNDKALDKIRALKSIKSVSLLHQLLDTPLDLVGDVVTNLSDGEIAHEIRENSGKESSTTTGREILSTSLHTVWDPSMPSIR